MWVNLYVHNGYESSTQSCYSSIIFQVIVPVCTSNNLISFIYKYIRKFAMKMLLKDNTEYNYKNLWQIYI